MSQWKRKLNGQKSILLLQPHSTSAPENHISLTGPRFDFFLSGHNGLYYRPGRITLRGENGAGKSTLLMLVKNALNDRAFFLPTQNQLSFTSEANKYSTGESLRNRLLEILERVNVDVLLLDEWDANLDKENHERFPCLSMNLRKKNV